MSAPWRAPQPREDERRTPGRWMWSRRGGPGGGQRLIDALDEPARRLGAELDGDPGTRTTRRVGEVDVERVIERRMERVVEVHAGRRDRHPTLRTLGAAGDLGGDREVGAHGQLPAR